MLASEFEILLDRYEHDPVQCSKLLRAHALAEPKQFLSYAKLAILERPICDSVKCLIAVALSAGLIEHILALHPESREAALGLAKRVSASKPRFDAHLLEFLKRPISALSEEGAALWIGIDILNEISMDDSLVPGILKLVKHPNAKVRSKAALFIGSRAQNLAWVGSLTEEHDPRVRANIIESLYSSDSEFVPHIFRSNVDDSNCRVAGNAVLGLYLLGDPTSILHIHQFVKHPEARFRNTGAWLMGKTRNPRFSAALSELMTDPDELVRRQALKALSEIRKNLRVMTTRPQLKITIMDVRSSERTLVATVQDNDGQFVRNIPSTSFVLKAGTPAKAVRSYAVEEREGHSSLSICFVLCLSPKYQEDLHTHFLHAIEACSSLRRAEDKWAIAKFILSPGQNSTGAVQNSPYLEYSLAQDVIESMLGAKPFPENLDPDRDMNALAAESLLGANGAVDYPQWIIFGAGEEQGLIQSLLDTNVMATVHVLAEAPAWQTSAARQLTQKTRGSYRQIASAEKMQQACTEVYSSLLHHYHISWEEDAERVELDIYSESGKGSAVLELSLEEPVSA
jgi:HEAT repeat protein